MQNADQQAAKPGALSSVLSIFNSSIGRKIVTGLTGLGLVGFTVGHLAGNLTLFGGAGPFNAYAHKLESLGPLLYVVEIGLIALFVLHIFFTVAVTVQNKAARKSRYVQGGNAGKPSQKSLSSQTMIYTGSILALFVVVHVWMFKFGPGMAAGYNYELHGDQVRDLHRLVVESFKNIWIVLGYVGVTALLGVHVRHGFWSAFQSLGANHPRYMPIIRALGIFTAVLLGVGFVVLPLYIYFAVPLPTV
ncbi:MAG: succinate dehydrogenase cytochrome b subunit [Candidatus Sericytochromatia bacterium]